MKELVSLNAYLPVRLDGQHGLCLALGPSALLVDCEERLEVGSELGIRLFLSPGSRAAGRAEVVDELDGASEGTALVEFRGIPVSLIESGVSESR